jgi:chromosome segregation ATPase
VDKEMEPSVDAAKNQMDGISRQMQGITHKLRELESSGGADSLAMFGGSCTEIDRMVKQAQTEGRWTGPVAGPIGANIHIAAGKEKYAAIAKHALGGKSLDHYVVTNNHDRQLFQSIREQAQCNSSECGIYQVFNSPRYNVPPPPSADVETVVTCLNIDNELCLMLWSIT